MGSDSIPLWIIFIICVIGGAYFAATESSFSAVNKIKIKAMAYDGNKSAKGVHYVGIPCFAVETITSFLV